MAANTDPDKLVKPVTNRVAESYPQVSHGHISSLAIPGGPARRRRPPRRTRIRAGDARERRLFDRGGQLRRRFDPGGDGVRLRLFHQPLSKLVNQVDSHALRVDSQDEVLALTAGSGSFGAGQPSRLATLNVTCSCIRPKCSSTAVGSSQSRAATINRSVAESKRVTSRRTAAVIIKRT